MFKNELIQLRNGWLQQASQDLSNRINDFMEQNRLNETELADALALDVTDVRNMLRGQNVSLLDFATILIATGNVLRIEPIENTPLAQQGGMRKMPMPRPSHSMPNRDSNGRFASKRKTVPSNPTAEPEMPVPSQRNWGGMLGVQNPNPTPSVAQQATTNAPCFDSMKRSALVELVKAHHWDSEIDLDEADRSQIIAFLESKNQPKVDETAPQMPMDGSTTQMMQMVLSELANNPQMLKQFMDQMPKTR